jgi:hypothetical protein
VLVVVVVVVVVVVGVSAIYPPATPAQQRKTHRGWPSVLW